MSIDWQKVAQQNGLNPEEFSAEVLSVAACIGAMRIDGEGESGEALRFTCSDDVGKIEVIIRRVE